MNWFGWLDLYIATSTIDNNVMNPNAMHTTVVLENTAESKHQEHKLKSKNLNRYIMQSRLSKKSNSTFSFRGVRITN